MSRRRSHGRQVGRLNSNQYYKSNHPARRATKGEAGRRKMPFLLVVLVVGLIAYLFYAGLQPVDRIRITAPDEFEQRVQESAEEVLANVPRRSLTFDTEGYGRLLNSRLREVGTVMVSHRPLSQELNVTIDAHQPAILWQSRGESFVLSREGRALRRARGEDKGLSLVFDDSNLPVEIGSPVVPAGFVDFVSQLGQELSKAKLSVDELYVVASTRELSMKLKGASYIVQMRTDRPAGEAVADLIDMQQFLRQRNLSADKYIDLRVAERAFWR